MTAKQKLQYHIKTFRAMHEWQRLQKARLSIAPLGPPYRKVELFSFKIRWFFFSLFLKTKAGYKWQERKHIRFYKRITGAA